MKMELIQPFINAADAVLAETLQSPTKIADVNMEEDAYRRKGVAAIITIMGDIEGRVIFDIEPAAATKIASVLAGTPVEESGSIVGETIFELAHLGIGHAVSTLNDLGFRFNVRPT